MAKYIARECPKCGGYVGVVVSELRSEPERPVIGSCARCKYSF